MNLRELRYLIALAECLNFSRAAERCAVTQSTLSIQLRKLEGYLGVTLFDRDRLHVALTPDGAQVLRLARVVVGAADEIVHFSHAQARNAAALSARPTPAVLAARLIDDINYRRSPRH